MAELYTYAVARIRAKEASMLDMADLEQVLSAKDEKTAISILADKGFSGRGDVLGAEQLLKEESEKTLEFLKEIMGDLSAFDVFLYKEDFHNLKAAIKSVVSGMFRKEVFVSSGTVDYNEIVDAVRERNFFALEGLFKRKEQAEVGKLFAKAAEEGMNVLLKTGDGQLCDVVVDKAALMAIYKAGAASENEMIKDYAELTVALCDIKTAARCCKMKKSFEFAKKALAPCKTIDCEQLAKAAAKGFDELCDYLGLTVYSKCADALKKSFSEFEKCCDNIIMEKIKKQKSNPFTLGPVAAYYLAKETELKAVRMVLSGVKNNLGENSVKERLMELYV